MRFVIITGMSGAGKSSAVRSLEDIGYYCIDNMPPALIPKFAEICFGGKGKFDKVAIVCDSRNGDDFDELLFALSEMKDNHYDYEILFLDAKDDKLIKRFKETRRKHPLAEQEGLATAIEKERNILKPLLKKATYVIDTSKKMPAELRQEIIGYFQPKENNGELLINIITFGFKFGIPLDADLVFDVRFMPNPFYIPELKKLTGENKAVADYVMSFKQCRGFLKQLIEMVDYLLPYYIDEGKSQLVIAIGCTGGRHRSVSIAEELYKHIKENTKSIAIINHRDSQKK